MIITIKFILQLFLNALLEVNYVSFGYIIL